MPLFYHYSSALAGLVQLDEDTSRHIIQVLRLHEGDRVQLTNGLGVLADSVISVADKKRAQVTVQSASQSAAPALRICLAISLLKNTNRIEWLLEKVTEIGITDIVPLLCERTEKERFRTERMQGILVSAMLQSQQTWLPLLHQPVNSNHFFNDPRWSSLTDKFIAHCMDGEKPPLKQAFEKTGDRVLAIGPEGDFTPNELQLAVDAGFRPVSLGTTRLRTETAGLVGSVIMKYA